MVEDPRDFRAPGAGLSRRDFLAAGALLNVMHSVDAAGVGVRENIESFGKDAGKVAKLRAAVAALQARDPQLANPTSWFHMAGVHDIPPDDPRIPQVPKELRTLWGQCHRDPSLFFLWHRAYVSAMERLMQDAIGDAAFRIPYWNWYVNPELPAIFRPEFLDPDKKVRNPLFMRSRSQGVNDGRPVWAPQVLSDFKSGSFSGFQQELARSEHSDIHMGVGTRQNMGNTLTAARDPVFWLHHANIDRLLVCWLKTGPGSTAVPGAFPRWDANKTYRFPLAGGGFAKPTVAELALGSAEALGYRYDDTSAPALQAPPVPLPPELLEVAGVSSGIQKQGVTTLSVRKSIAVGAGVSISLPLASGHGQKLQALGAKSAASGGFTSAAVVLRDVRLRSSAPAEVLGYSVYLNLPAQQAGAAHDEHFVGSISLFELSGGHSHGGGSELRFPVTEKLSRLLQKPGASSTRVSVSILPRLAPGGGQPGTPALDIGEVRLEASNLPVK